MGKCKYCSADAEYKIMVEDDDPSKYHTEDVCSECLNKPEIKAELIEAWTKTEWLSME